MQYPVRHPGQSSSYFAMSICRSNQVFPVINDSFYSVRHLFTMGLACIRHKHSSSIRVTDVIYNTLHDAYLFSELLSMIELLEQLAKADIWIICCIYANSKTHFDLQPFFGGKVNNGENDFDALIREGVEETGLHIRKENVHYMLSDWEYRKRTKFCICFHGINPIQFNHNPQDTKKCTKIYGLIFTSKQCAGDIIENLDVAHGQKEDKDLIGYVAIPVCEFVNSLKLNH